MKKLTKFFNLIKENKQTRILSVMTIAMLFIFTIGYSLSMFTGGSNKTVANIKVNDLSFNITTNSGESNDRILHLQAGKTELFKITITNLNKIDTKYELIYKVCTDVKCTSYLDTLPVDVKIGLNPAFTSVVNGTLVVSSSSEVNILTGNNTSTDYYILLDLQAGYSWNDLVLLNQFNDFSKYVSIIAYVDGVEVAEYPDSCNYIAEIIGYKNNKQITLEEAGGTCTNNKWKISYVGMPDKIQIKFKKRLTISEYLASLDKSSNGLEVDDTDDQNLRYVGTTPKNYISFNNELWRIIGVFNVYNNDTKSFQKLVKIIRNESLGLYSWDSSASDVNSGSGVNEWSQADLMTELNTDYIDTSKTSGTTTWYNGKNNQKTGTYDYSKNIKIEYVGKIANVRWNLGSAKWQWEVSNDEATDRLSIYKLERGTVHIINPSDGVERKDYWDGKIGLMYPSDFGYADMSCNYYISCGKNAWISHNNYENFKYDWTLTTYNQFANGVYYVGDGFDEAYAATDYNVYPVLYLKQDVEIDSGTGTDDNPYTIEIGNFKNDSWETIANNVKMGKGNLYSVGSEKEIDIDGKNYTVRVANNSTPDECNSSDFSYTACGFVVEFVDILDMRKFNTADTCKGGWPDTPVRTYANGDFFNKLSSDLQKVIIDTKVISSYGTTDTSNFVSTDKIYLLSTKEVWTDGSSNIISTYDTSYSNTRQLDYYAIKEVTTSNYNSAIKKYNGTNSNWWLRTAYSGGKISFVNVVSDGSWKYNHATTSIGFAPAFRIG